MSNVLTEARKRVELRLGPLRRERNKQQTGDDAAGVDVVKIRVDALLKRFFVKELVLHLVLQIIIERPVENARQEKKQNEGNVLHCVNFRELGHLHEGLVGERSECRSQNGSIYQGLGRV